ncbi:MAG: hypothetical protein EA402_03315 [Planctomycetota bacterium]|nr:MAG: hypothetical protein EA402_03315 [Planctomycetota bacterium]
MQNQAEPKANDDSSHRLDERAIKRLIAKQIENRCETLERQVAMLEAILRRKADLQYLSINEVCQRYRLNHRRVKEAIRIGAIEAAARPNGRGGRTTYLIRADEAERYWGSGLPV